MAINFLNITETLVEARINDNTVGSNLPTPRLAFKENGVVSGGISTTGGNLILETSSGTERVRITTTGNAVFAGDISLADGKKLQLGAANDLQIYHDASHSYITNSTGDLTISNTGDDLILKSADDFLLYVQGTELAIQAVGNSGVILRHNNVVKFETTSSGVTVTGEATIDSSTATLNIKGSNTGASLINFADAADGNVGRIYYDHTDNFMQFKVNDAEKMRIDSSGRVGIGMTPSDYAGYMLQIDGDTQAFISIGNTTTGEGALNGLVIGNDATGADIYQREAQPLRFHTSNTEAMRITSSGFVGIGSNSPVAPLEVKSSELNHLTLYRPANTTEGNAGSMNFDGNDSDSNQQTYAKIESFTDDATAGSHAGKISFSIAKGASGITSAMTIQKDAQVSLNQYGQGSYTGTAAYTLQVDSAGNIIEGSTSGGGTVTGSGTATRVAFWSGTTALSSNANLYWDNTNDRLGIGATSPSQKLEVRGNSLADKSLGIRTNYATQAGWSPATTLSSAPTGFFGGNFTINGTSTENNIAYGENEKGQRGLIWRAQNNDTGSNADGGWNKYIQNLDNNMSYMSIVYVKRVGTSTNGSFYHGCDGGNTLNLSGSTNTNPYFRSFNISNLPQDVWCVSIGIIQANNDSNTTNPSIGGVYRLDTGQKITAIGTALGFKMRGANNNQVHRTFLYYSTSSSAELNWSNPGFYAMDGSEPTLAEIVEGESTSGDYLPLAGGTMTGNTDHNDSVESRFGNSGDFIIKHTGSTYLSNTSGSLYFRGQTTDGDIIFQNDDGSGGLATYFYLDGSLVNGSSILGATRFPDKSQIFLGTGGDMALYHDGTNSFISNGTGDITIENSQNDGDIFFRSDDGAGGLATYLQLDGGTAITKAHKIIRFLDGVKSTFGNTDDLQIYHNGSNSFIQDVGTGFLAIDTNGTDVRITKSDSEYIAKFITDGAVELYYDSAKKFETTSTGVTVTGVAKIQYNGVGLDVENTASNGADTGIRIRGARNGQSFASGNLTSYALFSNYDDNTTPNNYDLAKIGAGMYDAAADTGYFRIMTNNGTAMTKALDIDKSQNALFYANVGIGTTAPSTFLQLGTYAVAGKYINQATYPDIPSEHMIHITAPSTSAYYGGGISFGETAFTAANIVVRDAGGSGALDLCFGTGTSSGVTEKMRIANSGNVGIGMIPDAAVLLSVSGQIGTTNGTAAAPTHTFYGDDDTGMFRAAANTLAFSSGGSERIRIEAGGDVGINITNPNAKLHVDEPSTSANSLTFGANAGQIFTNENSEFAFGLLNAAPYPLYIQGRRNTNQARDISFQGLGGNIGIGTYSSDGKLTISGGGISTAPTISVINTSSSTFNHSINAFAPNLTSGESNILVFGRAGSTKNSAYIGYRYSGTSGSNNNLLILGHWASDNLMTISGDGKVGIGTGTTAASEKLDVNGNIHLSANESYISFNTSASSGHPKIKMESDADFSFLNTAGSSLMRIENGGDVGIGTTAPTALLEVKKNISTAYDASEDAGQDSNTATVLVSNDDATVNSFSQVVFHNRSSGRGISRIVSINTASASTDLAFVTEHSNTKSEKMRIDSSGNVGIGTDNPSSLLHLSSASSPTLRIVDTTNSVTLLAFSQDTNAGFGTFSAHQLNFYVNSSAAMVIDGSQNVGIGLTADVGKLGTVNFGGVRLHIRGSGNIARAALEGTVQATVLMRVSGTTASANSKIKFIQSKGGEYRMGSVDDNGTERTQLSIENNGDTHIEDGSLEVDTADKGLILKSANGNRFRITVDNGGTLTSTQIG